jgi:hypothetical protein
MFWVHISYICFWACYENTSGYVTCYKSLGTCYATGMLCAPRVLAVTWELPDMDRSSPAGKKCWGALTSFLVKEA